ncbi:MAG: hypothetical protein ACJ8GL_08030, partial [Bacillus sp. (in: firmicutes)]
GILDKIGVGRRLEMMTRKEYLEAITFVNEDEERYKRLVRLISNRLDRDLTGKEIKYIHWMAGIDTEAFEVFEKIFEDIG